MQTLILDDGFGKDIVKMDIDNKSNKVVTTAVISVGIYAVVLLSNREMVYKTKLLIVK